MVSPKICTFLSFFLLGGINGITWGKESLPMPAEVVFVSTEGRDHIMKREIRFVRTEVREDNTPPTYEGGFSGKDYQRDPITGKIKIVPFRLDEAGNGDCWPTTLPDQGPRQKLQKIHCDNDGYAEGGSTGVTATREGSGQFFRIIGYVKNRPEAGQNWTKDFGHHFKIKKIIWDCP